MKNLILTIIVVWAIFHFWGQRKSSSESEYGTTYEDYEYSNESDEEESVTRDNWVCTEDCSGHDAGYEWAKEKGITNPDDCGGNSDSFVEGCEAYGNEYEIGGGPDNYEDYDYGY